jgi:hypothetical protein
VRELGDALVHVRQREVLLALRIHVLRLLSSYNIALKFAVIML